ncbi:hypothetical protein EDC01DRAFT_642629 [Geopyxis carbonaria]|nr:hypothetical protein EDC01DRAFT_642629 [Geopyxis carbonaria]
MTASSMATSTSPPSSKSNTEKDKDSNAHRLRENQRRSRLRKKEYLASLEARFRDCQRTGIEASVEIQNAAKRVVRENQKLRGLLRIRGVPDSEVELWLRSGDLASDAGELTAVDAVEKALRRRPCNAEPLDNPDSKDMGRRKSTGMVNERRGGGSPCSIAVRTSCGESNSTVCGPTRIQPQHPQLDPQQLPPQQPPHDQLSPLSSSASTASYSPMSPTHSAAPSSSSYVLAHNLPSTIMHNPGFPSAHSQPPVFAPVPEEHQSMYSLHSPSISGPGNHGVPAYAGNFYHQQQQQPHPQQQHGQQQHHGHHQQQHGGYMTNSAPQDSMPCDVARSMMEGMHPVPNNVALGPQDSGPGCVVQNNMIYSVSDRM